MAKNQHHPLAIINIPPFHKQKKEVKKYDPKFTLRKGYIENNILTQFIHADMPGSSDVEKQERIFSSFEDILKHSSVCSEKVYKDTWEQGDVFWGVANKQIDSGRKDLPSDIIIVCRWEYGRKPLFGFVDDLQFEWYDKTNFAKILVNRPFLTKLLETKRDKKKEQLFYEKQMSKIVRSVLDQEMLNGENKEHYVIWSAGLRRKGFSFVANPKLSKDERFVLPSDVHQIRYSDLEEDAPDADTLGNNKKWKSVDQSIIVSRNSGLFTDEDGFRFLSVGQKNDTTMRAKLEQNSEEANEIITRQRVREIIPMFEPNKEERKRIALKVDGIRKGTITFNKETSDVLPIQEIDNIFRDFRL